MAFSIHLYTVGSNFNMARNEVYGVASVAGKIEMTPNQVYGMGGLRTSGTDIAMTTNEGYGAFAANSGHTSNHVMESEAEGEYDYI